MAGIVVGRKNAERECIQPTGERAEVRCELGAQVRNFDCALEGGRKWHGELQLGRKLRGGSQLEKPAKLRPSERGEGLGRHALVAFGWLPASFRVAPGAALGTLTRGPSPIEGEGKQRGSAGGDTWRRGRCGIVWRVRRSGGPGGSSPVRKGREWRAVCWLGGPEDRHLGFTGECRPFGPPMIHLYDP